MIFVMIPRGIQKIYTFPILVVLKKEITFDLEMTFDLDRLKNLMSPSHGARSPLYTHIRFWYIQSIYTEINADNECDRETERQTD